MVYGASTAVGYFAIKLAKIGNNHPIIAVGGNVILMLKVCQIARRVTP